MIILALDVGEKRIGVAVCDPMEIITIGLPTIERQDIESDFKRLQDIVKDRKVDLIVLGLPLHMKGELGIMAQKILEFKEILEKNIQLPVECMDERLTTVEAQRVLLEGDVSRKKRKTKIDQIAAHLILQKYLERKHFKNELPR